MFDVRCFFCSSSPHFPFPVDPSHPHHDLHSHFRSIYNLLPSFSLVRQTLVRPSEIPVTSNLPTMPRNPRDEENHDSYQIIFPRHIPILKCDFPLPLFGKASFTRLSCFTPHQTPSRLPISFSIIMPVSPRNTTQPLH